MILVHFYIYHIMCFHRDLIICHLIWVSIGLGLHNFVLGSIFITTQISLLFLIRRPSIWLGLFQPVSRCIIINEALCVRSISVALGKMFFELFISAIFWKEIFISLCILRSNRSLFMCSSSSMCINILFEDLCPMCIELCMEIRFVQLWKMGVFF